MSPNTQHSAIDFSYLAVLLLLAYVMSSAPKYFRQFRENHQDIKIEKVSPIKQVLQIGRYYTIEPYMRVWNQLSHAKASHLASIQNPSR